MEKLLKNRNQKIEDDDLNSPRPQTNYGNPFKKIFTKHENNCEKRCKPMTDEIRNKLNIVLANEFKPVRYCQGSMTKLYHLNKRIPYIFEKPVEIVEAKYGWQITNISEADDKNIRNILLQFLPEEDYFKMEYYAHLFNTQIYDACNNVLKSIPMGHKWYIVIRILGLKIRTDESIAPMMDIVEARQIN